MWDASGQKRCYRSIADPFHTIEEMLALRVREILYPLGVFEEINQTRKKKKKKEEGKIKKRQRKEKGTRGVSVLVGQV